MENKTRTGLIAFDLETALKNPERVRTRDGKTISEIHYFKTLKSNCPVFAIIESDMMSFTRQGTYYNDKTTSIYDLFLTEPEMWVYLYKDSNFGSAPSGIFSSKREADMIGGQSSLGTYKLVKE